MGFSIKFNKTNFLSPQITSNERIFPFTEGIFCLKYHKNCIFFEGGVFPLKSLTIKKWLPTESHTLGGCLIKEGT